MANVLRSAVAIGVVGAGAWAMGTAWGQQAATRGAAPAQSAAPVPQGRGRAGARGGLPGATADQNLAVAALERDTTALLQALGKARGELLAAELSWPPDPKGVQEKMAVTLAAELELGRARVAALEKLQQSSTPLADAQIKSLATRTGAGPTGVRGTNAVPPIPHMTSKQVAALTQFTGTLQKAAEQVASVRAAVAATALNGLVDDRVLQAQIELVKISEIALAETRAAGLAKLQATAEKLDAEQLAALVANGGVLTSGNFNEPAAYAFNDHEGYVPLFDGKTLKGWDGNLKFWRVEDGAIIGESTTQNPSGNTYIAYRDLQAKDFTLKFEIKTEGSGGSGLQYRSQTGVPWLTPVGANVIANTGPLNLDWMMTGPQADFWPVRVYTGQFYSENTPMRIMAWRGQVVEGAGMTQRHLLGNIGDRTELGKLVKQNDWNEYVVVARGGVFMHIVNGQLMAAMIDDDPDSSNNQTGLFGIEIEATTKVSVRNIWVKVVK